MQLIIKFFQLLNLFSRFLSQVISRQRSHNFSHLTQGCNYIFESMNAGITGYMTGVSKGVKSGDYIILKHEHQLCRYQVIDIDYYTAPADMWTAFLKLAPQVSQLSSD